MLTNYILSEVAITILSPVAPLDVEGVKYSVVQQTSQALSVRLSTMCHDNGINARFFLEEETENIWLSRKKKPACFFYLRSS